ncbi:uncharacterized protein LOC123555718 [Mercenaria mercenaria]|uniref:uncharacterized protein LOC123555718 n=1 Tax=Mercenaria mercenaria TaxID=6596 RepID=UPI00234F698E|nr:uncharacterized protein LOC123555718 [Mercenaria mercenaria]
MPRGRGRFRRRGNRQNAHQEAHMRLRRRDRPAADINAANFGCNARQNNAENDRLRRRDRQAAVVNAAANVHVEALENDGEAEVIVQNAEIQTDPPPEDPRGQKRTADDLDEDSNDLLQPDSDVWILGDSIPYWAGVRARTTGKPNLRLPGKTIAWRAVRGLRWQTLRNCIEASVLLASPPKILVINLGGNDLTSRSILQIRNVIEREIKYFRAAFPDTVIIWVDILPRRKWQGALKSWKTIEFKRRRINRWGRYLVSCKGRYDSLSHDIDVETEFWLRDGVHLNDVGLEFYLDGLRDILLKNLS